MPSCDTCGSGFEGRSDARYCSPACKQKALRSRDSNGRHDGHSEPAAAVLPVEDDAPMVPVRYDPATGNVVGHGFKCRCRYCAPLGEPARESCR